MLHKSTLDFLKALKKNNNRDWFTKNKDKFEEAKKDFHDFVQELINEVAKFDKSISGIEAKKCIFRIYRDVRFSKDKKPYKTNFGASFSKGGKNSPNAGYYIHIEADGKSFLGGGMYMPEPDNLNKIRQEIDYNINDFKKIIYGKSFKNTFGELWSEDKLKNAPKNYPKDHPHIDLLKHKHYIAGADVNEKQVLSKNFLKQCAKIFKELKSLNDFLNTAIS